MTKSKKELVRKCARMLIKRWETKNGKKATKKISKGVLMQLRADMRLMPYEKCLTVYNRLKQHPLELLAIGGQNGSERNEPHALAKSR